MSKISRRDFIKLSAAALGGLALRPFTPALAQFDDADLVRVATTSVSVHTKPNDESRIVGQWFRDDLIRIYEEINAGAPVHNPIWYRVWGGYIHRGHLQKVNTRYNKPLSSILEGARQIADVTVPYTQAMRYTRTYGWQPNLRLYYESVHWIVGVDEGPDGEPWYRIFDELIGFPYHVQAIHLRPIPFEEWSPISPDIPLDQKRIEVNITTQILTAFEIDKKIFETNISSGVASWQPDPKALNTRTPTGEFRILEKYPSKHMGDGNLFAGIEDYELPGVPWTCFFSEAGYAFHGTYWHDNYGTPMSNGCVNMRVEEAKWLFRWARPPHKPEQILSRGLGTVVVITP